MITNNTNINKFSSAPGIRGSKPAKPPALKLTPQESFEPSAGDSNKGKLLLLGLGAAVAVVGLSGCTAPSNPPPISQCTSDQFTASTEDGTLKVEVIPSELGTIDLVRQTTTETDTDSDGDTTTTTEDVPLSPIGVYLGDGIFLDSNGNLSLVPARAFGVQVTPSDATSIRVSPDGWGNDFTIERNGSNVEVDAQGFGKLNAFTVREGENSAYIDVPSIGGLGDVRIDRRGNTTTIDPVGFGSWDQMRIVRNGNTIRVEQPGWRSDIIITKTENSFSVDYPGWGGEAKAHFCKDEITIDHYGSWSDVKLKKDGDKISIDRRGWRADSEITLRPGGAKVDSESWLGDTQISIQR